MSTYLTVTDLRQANIKRQKYWQAKAETSWNIAKLYGALLNEAGEAAGARKKLDRLDDGIADLGAHLGLSHESLMLDLGYEIADAIIYLDILAEKLGMRAEFFESYEHNFPEVSSFLGGEDITVELGIWLGILGEKIRHLRREDSIMPHAIPPLSPQTQKSLRRCQKYLMIMAQYYGVNLSDAIVWKFNAVSERYGFPVWLGDMPKNAAAV
ncbi:hypothetical protein DES40_1743 [Litorimonas taeanensis]|uniref:MazG-like nucleotide pyrophosphohydrolase family protein n=1 Tax=Litorimonas taeanensis TaxID=568099 RepID=A0A420WD76_9PROT|nr:MazG-like family protein [Litorimonas taeanensis]RKQ68967.1 hypothetical protein DES40_1743 [Litorimonas taeanensis]